MVFLDTMESASVPSWARIGKSTIFNLAPNPQTETNDFIEDEMPTEEVMNYAPELPQELQCNKGDPAFDHMYDMFYNLPTGEEVKRNVLIVFAGNEGTETAPVFRAWSTKATIIVETFDTVAEKISFKIKINNIDRVKVTLTDGIPAIVTETTGE